MIEGKQLDTRERHAAHVQRTAQRRFLQQVERAPLLSFVVMLAARRPIRGKASASSTTTSDIEASAT